MDFFSNLNFTRVVILLSVLGSAALGYLAYAKTQQLAELEDQVRLRAPLVVKDIQLKAKQLDLLQRQRDREGLVGQENPENYIRSIARDPNVDIGQVTIKSSDKPIGGGVVDKTYKIDPDYQLDPSKSYNNRVQISNYLYSLERESRRVKVTQFKIEPKDKVKPEDVLNDRWTFTAEMTSRQVEGE